MVQGSLTLSSSVLGCLETGHGGALGSYTKAKNMTMDALGPDPGLLHPWTAHRPLWTLHPHSDPGVSQAGSQHRDRGGMTGTRNNTDGQGPAGGGALQAWGLDL